MRKAHTTIYRGRSFDNYHLDPMLISTLSHV